MAYLPNMKSHLFIGLEIRFLFPIHQTALYSGKGKQQDQSETIYFDLSRLLNLKVARSTLIQRKTKDDSQVLHLFWVGEISYKVPSHLCILEEGLGWKQIKSIQHTTQKIQAFYEKLFTVFSRLNKFNFVPTQKCSFNSSLFYWVLMLTADLLYLVWPCVCVSIWL